MTETAKAFRREIDLKDGSGVQVFEGDTAEELNDKLGEAQVNATRKIRQQEQELQSLRRQVISQPERGEDDPEGPLLEFKPRALSTDELFALGQRLQNPATAAAALQEGLEAGLGATLADVRRVLAKADLTPRQISANQAAESFLMRHPEFVTSPKNSDEIHGHMQRKKMAPTLKNYEIAFGELKASGLLELRAPRVASTNGDKPPGDGGAGDSPPPAPASETPRFASTSVVTRGSGTPRGTGGSKLPTAEEISRMSAAEHRRWVNDPVHGKAFRDHEERIAQAQAARARR
jgi:hypothetical protein